MLPTKGQDIRQLQEAILAKDEEIQGIIEAWQNEYRFMAETGINLPLAMKGIGEKQ